MNDHKCVVKTRIKAFKALRLLDTMANLKGSNEEGAVARVLTDVRTRINAVDHALRMPGPTDRA